MTPYPTAGAKVTEFEARLDAQLGPEAPARGRGRPPKEKAPEPIERTFDIKVVAQVISIPYDLWSISQATPALKLRDDEAMLMALPAKELLDYYLPQIPVIAWAWISLSIGLYASMKPRLELIQVLKLQKQKASAGVTSAARPAGTPNPPGPLHPPASAVFPSEINVEKV